MDNWTEEGRGREDNPPVGEIGQVTWGREERPLTVFVPWDCGKSCPFCTTKEEYGTKYVAADVDENLFRVKTTVRRVLDLRLVDEVVLTGGEPLADPVRLRELVAWIRGTCSFDGRLYVNTSFHDWVDGTELPLSVARRIQVRPGVREQNRRINRGMLSCRVGPHTLPDDERFFPAE